MERIKAVKKLQDMVLNTIYRNNISMHQLPPVLRKNIDLEFAAEKGDMNGVLNSLYHMRNARYTNLTYYSIEKGMKYLMEAKLLKQFKIVFELIRDNKILISDDDDEFSLALFQFNMFIHACMTNNLEVVIYLSDKISHSHKRQATIHSIEIDVCVDDVMTHALYSFDRKMVDIIYKTLTKLGKFEWTSDDDEPIEYYLLYIA